MNNSTGAPEHSSGDDGGGGASLQAVNRIGWLLLFALRWLVGSCSCYFSSTTSGTQHTKSIQCKHNDDHDDDHSAPTAVGEAPTKFAKCRLQHQPNRHNCAQEHPKLDCISWVHHQTHCWASTLRHDDHGGPLTRLAGRRRR